MKNRTACLTFCIFFISFTGWCQKQEGNVSTISTLVSSDTRVNLQRKIGLDSDSKSKEVILNIEEHVDRFEIAINSSVAAGQLEIEVYDPKGNNQGTFSVGTQLDEEKSERVNGNINKTLRDPEPGNWKVKIAPTEATGTVTIQTAVIKR